MSRTSTYRCGSRRLLAILGLIVLLTALLAPPLAGPASAQAHTSARRAPACSGDLLFAAAAKKEGFDPHDPSYAAMPAGDGAGAYQASCLHGWAFALVSRPNVGTTDGGTIFRARHHHWVEVDGVGFPLEASMCRLRLDTKVPAAALRHFFGASSACHVYVGAVTEQKPTSISLSGDSDTYLVHLHWRSWTVHHAVGTGRLDQAADDADGAPDATLTPVKVIATRPRNYAQFTDCSWGFGKIRILDRRSGTRLSVLTGSDLIQIQGSQCYPPR